MQSPGPGEPTPQAAPPPPPPPPTAAPYGSAQPAYPAQQYGNQPGWAAPQAGPAPGLVYAGFWIRFAAMLIDGIALYAILVLGNFLFVKGIDNGNGTVTIVQGAWWLPLWSVVEFLYYPVTWAWLGETVGHRILGMEIRRVEDGQRPGVGQVIVRYIGYIISVIIILIGLIIAAFDPRKQGLHDKIAGTVVVRKATG
jgi:uncharacterized RDD family membrane protein YckC